MAMNERDKAAKEQIIDILREEGYPTYATLFSLFDLHLTNDPKVVGYCIMSKATIVLNENLDEKAVSMLVRHELLHEYLEHLTRELTIRDNPRYKNIPHDVFNIAADYEISNLGYTDKDKLTVRTLMINDKLMRGLVTEDDHPDWVNLSFEEMLEKLADEYEKDEEQFMKELQEFNDALKDLNPEELQKLADQISDAVKNQSSQDQTTQRQPKGSGMPIPNLDQNGSRENSSNELKELQDLLNKVDNNLQKDRTETKEEPIRSEQEAEELTKLSDRVKLIKKTFNDLKKTKGLEQDVKVIREKEKVEKRRKELQKYKSSAIVKFEASLKDFLSKETGRQRYLTYSRLNKKYAHTPYIKKGVKRMTPNIVPVINIYFDRSYSFSTYPEKTKSAERALSMLSQYEHKGQIKVNLYYVNDKVYVDRQEAEQGAGGADATAIVNHVRLTRPDNVIVLTDRDASNSRTSYTVPGAV